MAVLCQTAASHLDCAQLTHRLTTAAPHPLPSGRFRGRQHDDFEWLSSAGVKPGAKIMVAETLGWRAERAAAMEGSRQASDAAAAGPVPVPLALAHPPAISPAEVADAQPVRFPHPTYHGQQAPPPWQQQPPGPAGPQMPLLGPQQQQQQWEQQQAGTYGPPAPGSYQQQQQQPQYPPPPQNWVPSSQNLYYTPQGYGPPAGLQGTGHQEGQQQYPPQAYYRYQQEQPPPQVPPQAPPQLPVHPPPQAAQQQQQPAIGPQLPPGMQSQSAQQPTPVRIDAHHRWTPRERAKWWINLVGE